MNNVFFVLLSLSVSGSILALVLLALRRISKGRFSQTWQYYIWLIVILRFLLPFAPGVNVVGQAAQYIQQNIAVPVQTVPDVEPWESGGEESPFITSEQNNLALQDGQSESTLQNYWNEAKSRIWLAWAIVVLVMLSHKIISYNNFTRFVKLRARKVTEDRVLDIFRAELAAMKINRQIPLYINDRIGSPMLVGLLRPAVVFPNTEGSADDLRHMLRHELTHYKRKDVLYKWLVQITKCLHWFNPLIYFIGKEIDKCCELSCDEAVIRHMSEAEREGYGDALIASLKSPEHYSAFVVSMTMSDNVKTLQERLETIMSYKRKSGIVTCMALLLTLLLLCGFTFLGAHDLIQGNSRDSLFAIQQNPLTDPQQPGSFPQAANGLTLVEVEYTLAELESKNIKGLEIAGLTAENQKAPGILSEDVIIKNGGNTLKIQYYQGSNNEYILDDTITDGGGTRGVIQLGRTASSSSTELERTIVVTIPDNANIISLNVYTGSGDVSINKREATLLTVRTESGNISIDDCTVPYILKLQTLSGNIDVANLSTDRPDSPYSFEADITSDRGQVVFQPSDSVSNYHFICATKSTNTLSINGKSYKTGETFVMNENVPKTVHITGYTKDGDGREGFGTASFIIKDKQGLSVGK